MQTKDFKNKKSCHTTEGFALKHTTKGFSYLHVVADSMANSWGTTVFWSWLSVDSGKLLVLYPFLPSNGDLRGGKQGETRYH